MPRYRLEIEYDGAPFSGWQRQDGQASVQAALEEAFAAFTGERPILHGAGRTDAGVHALSMTAHLDLVRAWPETTLMDACNAHLRPHPVVVLEARAASSDFHARFSCVERRYRYRLLCRRAPLALERGRLWRRPKPLDIEAMRAAAARLVGRHDFTSFRSVHCQAKDPVKTLDALVVEEREAGEIWVRARARSFLHKQVRNLVGALEQAGSGKATADGVEAMLRARDRTKAAPTAPAAGLFFERARYAEDDEP